MKAQTHQVPASDGKRLFVYSWLPESEPIRAVVHIAHGMGEHAARYESVARALCATGYATYANDHRGHGRTAESEEELGRFGPDGWNRCVRDLRELNQELRKRHPGLPIVLLGHSMGSFLTQLYLIEHGTTLDGAVISGSSAVSSGFWLVKLAARFERRRLGPDANSPLLDSLLFGGMNKAFENPRTDFDWLSRDPEEVDKYVADPLCGFVVRVQGLIDMFDGGKRTGQPEALRRIPNELPIYIFSGDQDPVHKNLKGLRKLLRNYEKAGLRRVAHRFYPEGRHEMFNETNRAEVIQDLISWLDRYF